MKLKSIDVRRACFQAKSRRRVFIELLDEDWTEGKVGKLFKLMYGAHDAAQNSEAEYAELMMGIGLKRGKISPCVFNNAERNSQAVIHGDDFTLPGKEEKLSWFKAQTKDKFEVKFRGSLGPCPSDDKSVRILDIVVEWTENGITYEPD